MGNSAGEIGWGKGGGNGVGQGVGGSFVCEEHRGVSV